MTTLKPIIETFDKDIFGEILVSDFIAQFKGVLRDGEANTEAVEAKQNFKDVQEVLKEIANEIQRENLKDFGTFLKGNDFNNDGMIPVAAFYQILE